MTISAKNIVHRVVDTLQDTTSIRWPVSELVRYLNDAQREVVMYRPDSMVTNTALACAQGARQSLPANGAKLIDVVRNQATNKAVRLTNREILDAQQPGWHAIAASTGVVHYTYDPRDPKVFYVYPPASGGTASATVTASGTSGEYVLTLAGVDGADVIKPGASFTTAPAGVPADATVQSVYVDAGATKILLNKALTANVVSQAAVLSSPTGVVLDIVYSAYPAEVAEPADGSDWDDVVGNISVPDIYANALQDFILYKSYSKDSEYAGNAQRAQAHYAAFANALGIEIKATVGVMPSSQGNPNVSKQPQMAA
jgi:hypothetical protein